MGKCQGQNTGLDELNVGYIQWAKATIRIQFKLLIDKCSFNLNFYNIFARTNKNIPMLFLIEVLFLIEAVPK